MFRSRGIWFNATGDTNATNDQSSCESNEAYQIQVGPGDAIPGISPHIGRVGLDTHHITT